LPLIILGKPIHTYTGIAIPHLVAISTNGHALPIGSSTEPYFADAPSILCELLIIPTLVIIIIIIVIGSIDTLIVPIPIVARHADTNIA
jgi:hypothetical protein